MRPPKECCLSAMLHVLQVAQRLHGEAPERLPFWLSMEIARRKGTLARYVTGGKKP